MSVRLGIDTPFTRVLSLLRRLRLRGGGAGAASPPVTAGTENAVTAAVGSPFNPPPAPTPLCTDRTDMCSFIVVSRDLRVSLNSALSSAVSCSDSFIVDPAFTAEDIANESEEMKRRNRRWRKFNQMRRTTKKKKEEKEEAEEVDCAEEEEDEEGEEMKEEEKKEKEMMKC